MDTPTIDAGTLKCRLDEGESFVLLDVLPAETWTELRIPGSVNACVYDMTFLEQVTALGIERTTEIVVHCSRPDCRASLDAADRLQRNGYENVVRFVGGREAWGASEYGFEGTADPAVWRPSTVGPVADGVYTIDIEKSLVEWIGRNAARGHDGTMRLAGGTVEIRHGFPAAGAIDIDMRSMEAGDLDGEMASLLVDHLESEDFFAADRFPLATVVIRGARPRPDAAPGSPNCELTVDLTLRVVTAEVPLTVTAAPHGDGGLAVQGHLDLDRTRWGATYGSGRLYDRLGMHLVNDLVTVGVRVIARRGADATVS